MERVKLELDDLEKNLCFDNNFGVSFGDIFFISRKGINVFFYVCRTTATQVCLFELAKKKIKVNGKTVNVLCPNLPPTRSPNVITKNNCWYKSNFWVDVKDEETILIPVTKDMPLYHKVTPPILGYFEATKISEEEKNNGVLNYYWDIF